VITVSFAGDILGGRLQVCGRSSGVERQSSKLNVEGSNPSVRSKLRVARLRLPIADSGAANDCGVIAQKGERLPCKQDVVGSIPSDSTILLKIWMPSSAIAVPQPGWCISISGCATFVKQRPTWSFRKCSML
jgi:hypothetical protein